jgi:sugar lactone lactonase YvrE
MLCEKAEKLPEGASEPCISPADSFEWRSWRSSQALERLATGFEFVEGPVWIPQASKQLESNDKCGTLLFNDIPVSKTYCFADGDCTVFRGDNGQANGNFFDLGIGLVCCEHGGRRVARVDSDGRPGTLISHYQGKRLNSPNDLVVSSDGSVWFTDPPYGVKDEERELPFQGVFQLSPDGQLKLVSSEFIKPNGLALSADEKKLFVADTEAGQIGVLQLTGDSKQNQAVTFCETPRPDGIRLDIQGNIWIAGLNGVEIFRADGSHLGQLPLPERPANLEFGGDDGRDLFICVRTSLYRFRTPWPGVTFTQRASAHA